MRWGCSTGGDNLTTALAKQLLPAVPECYRHWIISKLSTEENVLINDSRAFHFLCASINAFSACLHSTIGDLNHIKLDSGRQFTGFYSSLLNANVWFLHHGCNLLWVCCSHASWRWFIFMLMPTGGIFALLPACYYKAEYFMLLTVMSQQGAHPWEQDHDSVSNSIAVSICHVRQELLTELFSMSLFNNVMIAARNVIYN